MRIINCLNCKKVLAKSDDGLLGGIEIKCSKCKNINYILLTPKDVLATIRLYPSAKVECPPEHQFKSTT